MRISLRCIEKVLQWLRGPDNFIRRNDLVGIAGILRQQVVPSLSWRTKLAEKIEPHKNYQGPAFKWRAKRGRPRNLVAGDHVLEAMQSGDMAVIAAELRKPDGPDRGVLTWLADQFDPASEHCSRFVVIGPPKRRSPDPVVQARRIRVHAEIEEDKRRGKSLTTALYDAVIREIERTGRPFTYHQAKHAYYAAKKR